MQNHSEGELDSSERKGQRVSSTRVSVEVAKPIFAQQEIWLLLRYTLNDSLIDLKQNKQDTQGVMAF